MHMEYSTCLVCSANKFIAVHEAQIHSWPARCLLAVLSCLLGHSLSSLASGSSMNEDVWKGRGIGRREASTGLEVALGSRLKVAKRLLPTLLMRSRGQTEGSGLLACPFPTFQLVQVLKLSLWFSLAK